MHAPRNAQTSPDGTPEGLPDAELPSLGETCQRLVVEDDPRPVTVLQTLVVDHLLMNEGDVWWLDAVGHANATAFAQLAPSRRMLNRVQVARGFTAHQHHTLATDAIDEFHSDRGTEPSLIVAPGIDALYREADIATETATGLLVRSLASLTGAARRSDAGIVFTTTRSEGSDEFTEAVAATAPETLRCEQTGFGPRFVGEEFETLVYPVEGGIQTTLAYWAEVLQARATVATASETPQEVTARGSY